MKLFSLSFAINKRWFFLLILGVLLLPALALRIWTWQNHFTHIDDLLVYSYITQPTELDVAIAKAEGQQISQATVLNLSTAELRFDELHQSPHVEAIVNWLFDHHLSAVAQFGAAITPARSTQPSRSSTYAPAQYLLFGPLIQDYGDYQINLAVGRLPSFLFGLLAIGLVGLVLHRFQINKWVSMFFMLVLAYSSEHIIYSSQMSPYAAGVVVMLLIIWMLATPVQLNSLASITRWMSRLVLLAAIGVVFQFQTLFVLPALSLIIWAEVPKDKFLAKFIWLIRHLKMSIAAAFLIILMLFVLYLRGQVGRGINWNAGPNQEFLYIWQGIGHLFWFAVSNTKWVFLSMLTPLPFDGMPQMVRVIILIVLGGIFALGLLPSRQSPAKRRLAIFGYVVFGTWALLILTQQITYSPTRHSLFLVPLFIMFMAFGLDKLVQLTKTVIIPLSLSLGLLLIVGLTYHQFMVSRDNAFDPAQVIQLVKQYKPDVVLAYQWSQAALLMKSDLPPLFIANEGQPSFHLLPAPFSKVPTSNPRRIMLLSNIGAPRQMPASLLPLIKPIINLQDTNSYQVLYQSVVKSSTEIEFYPLTKNGTNEMYVMVVEVR